jgi:hypothetical protein
VIGLIILLMILHCAGCVGIAWLLFSLAGVPFNPLWGVGLWVLVMYIWGWTRRKYQ